MNQVSYQWNGNNLAEVQRWLRDLKPKIIIYTNQSKTQKLEINNDDNNDDNIIQITVGDYIVRNSDDNLEVSYCPVGELYISKEKSPSELAYQRMTATILAALHFTQVNMDDDITEMSLFNEVDCLDYDEINFLCDRIRLGNLVLKEV